LSWPSSRHVHPCCHVSAGLDNYRRNATTAFPSPPDAAIQPLALSLPNSLICMSLTCGPCGLRAGSRERGRNQEWPGESGMWPGTGNLEGCRSPQASAGTPGNTREPGDQARKTPTENGWGFGFGIGGGVVPRIKRLLKVRNRSAAGCCEPVRTRSKSLSVWLSAMGDQAGFSSWLVPGKAAQPRLHFGASSTPKRESNPRPTPRSKAHPFTPIRADCS